jgi:hypothetical protein
MVDVIVRDDHRMELTEKLLDRYIDDRCNVTGNFWMRMEDFGRAFWSWAGQQTDELHCVQEKPPLSLIEEFVGQRLRVRDHLGVKWVEVITIETEEEQDAEILAEAATEYLDEFLFDRCIVGRGLEVKRVRFDAEFDDWADDNVGLQGFCGEAFERELEKRFHATRSSALANPKDGQVLFGVSIPRIAVSPGQMLDSITVDRANKLPVKF